MTNYFTKLKKLRLLFKENGIDGYIVSTQDEYLSEYPPNHSKRLEYITGFTGSNALLVVLRKSTLFFTDARYLIQSLKELNKESFQIFNYKDLPIFPWENYLSLDTVIGYDPKIFSNMALSPFKGLKLKALKVNLVDKIWQAKPLKKNSTIYSYNITFSGEGNLQKFRKCQEFLNRYEASALVITTPEIVCWLFNIRSSDIDFSPLLLAHAYITKNKAYLFTDISRICTPLEGVTVLPERFFERIIQKEEGKILFDDRLCSQHISNIIKKRHYKDVINPCLLWKSCKNPTEIDNLRKVHVQDGIAVVEFLAFLSTNNLSNYSEYDLILKINKFRSRRHKYISNSFPPIIGFKENAAIIHYSAKKKTAKKIQGDGLLLIDSGGQYLGGTTDITRVVAIGKYEEEHLKYYTKVLKGHLSLAMIKFPKDSVTGANLDILARQFLWHEGNDYDHSTGHGVGNFLSVHEYPPNVSLNSYRTKLMTGMVISNEPGFYKEGSFGIRIENMMYVKEASQYSNFLEFGMLTLVPYEKKLINMLLLTQNELTYLADYYGMIEKEIMPYLSNNGKKWLKSQLEIVI